MILLPCAVMLHRLNRRDFLGRIAAGSATAALPCLSGAAGERPNILYVTADDHEVSASMVLSMPPTSATAWANFVGRSSIRSVFMTAAACTVPSWSELARAIGSVHGSRTSE